MAEQLANQAQSTLNGAIDNVVTTLVVASGTPFPSSGNFRIIIDSEIIIVGARSGNTLSSLTRGAEGTTATSHSNGVLVTHDLTKGGLDAYLKDVSHLTTSGTPDGSKFIRDDMTVQNVPTLIGVVTLSGSGTYTPTAGTKKVYVECVGGGGAGGGTPNAAGRAFGGGGGGGAYAASLLTSGFSGVSYSVGAGGTGVSAGAGNAGADTTFNTTGVVAKGGAGGAAGVNNTSVAGGAGGSAAASTGNHKASGGRGPGGSVAANLTQGGTSGLGFGQGGIVATEGATAAGVAGEAYGGGGSGSQTYTSGGAQTGGAGGAGTIRVWEFG